MSKQCGDEEHLETYPPAPSVSELMTGFKKVLERYPELRFDSSNDHLHYMVQAALGRNNLVQEMVRLVSKRHAGEAIRNYTGEERAKCDQAIVAVHEALNTCYTNTEALRFVNLTQDVSPDGEPWSEAKAYVACMLDKVGSVNPRAIGEA